MGSKSSVSPVTRTPMGEGSTKHPKGMDELPSKEVVVAFPLCLDINAITHVSPVPNLIFSLGHCYDASNYCKFKKRSLVKHFRNKGSVMKSVNIMHEGGLGLIDTNVDVVVGDVSDAAVKGILKINKGEEKSDNVSSKGVGRNEMHGVESDVGGERV